MPNLWIITIIDKLTSSHTECKWKQSPKKALHAWIWLRAAPSDQLQVVLTELGLWKRTRMVPGCLSEGLMSFITLRSFNSCSSFLPPNTNSCGPQKNIGCQFLEALVKIKDRNRGWVVNWMSLVAHWHGCGGWRTCVHIGGQEEFQRRAEPSTSSWLHSHVYTWFRQDFLLTSARTFTDVSIKSSCSVSLTDTEFVDFV